MAPFKKILVAHDFSVHADHATRLAVELAKAFDASITLLHVYNIPTYPLPEGFVLASPETVVELMERIDQAMKEARARAVALGGERVDTRLVEGAPALEVVRVAAEEKFDLVVMGTHGRNTLQHVLMGSVAEKVVRKAPCPVLTTHAPDAKGSAR